jgi:peroxisomal enoyl-CoA hydratase 2
MANKVKYDSVKVGDTIPTIVIDGVSRPDFVRYAGASGDFVPLHYDQTFVEAAGIPTVFAQGMWTAGCLSRCLTDYAGAGNVRRFKVRFSRQVWPGDTLTCRGTVTNKTERNGERVVEGDLEVLNQKGETTVKGNFAVVAA